MVTRLTTDKKIAQLKIAGQHDKDNLQDYLLFLS